MTSTANYTATYSGTGEQDMFICDQNYIYTIVVTGNSSDVYTVQGQTYPAGDRFDITTLIDQTSITDAVIDAPLFSIGLDIDTNNSGAIKLEIQGAAR